MLQRCRELGFALAGITEAAPSARAAELRAWIDAGRHGTMQYLARNLELREDVRRLLPGARSVVMVADQYATRNDPPEPEAPAPDGGPRRRGRIARYARGKDYHREIKRRLHTLCDELRAQHSAQCRAFCDTAPAPERELAARAGLGWIGKHTLLINPRRGSYLLLGGFVTTLDLVGPPTVPGPPGTPTVPGGPSKEDRARAAAPADPDLALGALVPDACGTCTRCIDACPTGAITPYSVDASRCISYLTIERRDPLPTWTEQKLSGWLFGCDICQEVCPHNSPRPEGVDVGAANPVYAPRRRDLDLREVLQWTAEDRSRELSGSSMKRATLAMLHRNARALLGEAAPPDRRSDEAGPRSGAA